MQWQLLATILLVGLCFVATTDDSKCIPPLFFKCPNTEKCISHVFVCDGEDDCGDNSDELREQCPQKLPSFADACKEHEFQCSDRFHCIPEDEYCDGKKDCIDGSDEADDCHVNKTCNGFQCKSGECILQSWACDSTADCRDGSDELNCSFKQNAIPPANCNNTIDKYLCANHRCIDLALACNNINNCGDQSDEDPADCQRAQESCKSSPCSSKCRPTPKGYQCACDTGYILKNHTCQDMDECDEWGLCDQTCVNNLGSYYCHCEIGYTLQSDGHSCKPDNGEALMIFATKTSIRGYYLESTIYYSIAENLQHVVGVSLNANYIYWSDIQLGEERIFRSLDDGTRREAIVTAGLGCPEDIAVDWITGNIYFTDSMYKHIGVCNDNGNYCTVLINEDADKPRGIVVMPSRGKMYWSDWGNNPHIAVSFMDGSKRQLFIKDKLGWPNGLTIDYPSERLYWVDAKLKVIESIHLDGVNRRTVLHDVAKHPYSIAIFGNRLYWSDWSTNSIHSCNKFTGKDFTTLVQKNETLYGIHIYHSTFSVKYANPCIAKPCSQLCLMAENQTYTCACTMDEELGTDRHTCRDSAKRKHVAIAAGSTIVNYYHELLGRPRVTSSVTADHISAMTYDSLKNTLIAADEMAHSIFRYDPQSSTVNHIMPIVDEVIESIAFDYLGNNLYKSNAMYRKIEVQSLNTGEKTEFSYPESPYDIVVIPEDGAMFMVFRLYDSFHIDRAQMNGLGSRIHVVEQGLFGPKISLAYDKDTKRVFWADEGTGRIESMDAQGQNRRLFRTGIASPVSIAVLDTDIFWTSRRSARLSWTDKKQVAPGVKGLNLTDISQRVDVSLLQSIDGPYTGPQHPCSRSNGDCSHVCLVSDLKNRLCACPSSFIVNSDMKTCKPKTSCSASETKCANSNKCISNVQKCNGVSDCPDGDDEENCPTLDASCKADEFACHNGQCIKKIERCDSVFQCADHSDEENCRNSCTSEQYRCRDGTCISSSLVCDGQNDCDDFSDEEDCADHPCDDHSFKCANGYCIPRNWECDGQPDCSDSSDEHETCRPVDCANGMFSCRNGRCIDVLLKCNGMDNCEDNSDEEDCAVEALICSRDQYRCKGSTKCIHSNLKCDGKDDCPMSDDEQACGRCLDSQFSCSNGRCLPREWTCDQVDDCGDNSDEEDCDHQHHEHEESHPAANCSREQFACKTGRCISLDNACDGEPNCADGSDEGGSCDSACLSSGDCENVCHKTPNGSVCSCRHGYALAADERSCADIDECTLGDCSQHCTNRPGSFACSCFEGYQLRLNKLSCKATGPAMKIVAATRDDIRILMPQLQRSSVKVLFRNPEVEINGLDTNARDETVYWSNEALGVINKLDMNKNKTRIAALDTLGRPQVLIVDWITDNVYVFDAKLPASIKACHVQTNKCSMMVEFDQSSSSVTAMGIEPILEILFFAQTRWQMSNAPTAEIIRSDLIGSNQKTVVDKSLGIVSGIAIDHHRALIYWADHYNAMIECSDFDGQYRKVITKNLLSKPVGLFLFEDTLYWKSEDSQVLNKRLLYNKMNYSTIAIVSNSINRLFVISQISRQPTSLNLCANHSCNHLCVIHKGRPLCLCRDGMLARLKNNTACQDEMIELDYGHPTDNHGDSSSPIVAAKSTDDDSSSDGNVWIGLTCGLLSFVALSATYYYVKTKRPDLMRRPNLKNPFDGIRFIKRRSDNAASTTSNNTLTLMPGKHEYANPISDMSNAWMNGAEVAHKNNQHQHVDSDEVSGSEMDEVTTTNIRSRLIE
ncbi:vitellogenin receptor-like [Phymastichus coffea]|uniref:vitellogenin receptor-like n=1 Tax=Phymastichus coffea TaxID=108790 RepID=UPI00273AACDD|nr:vitellogenin receptor-like [Phymastichus coffea]